MSLTISTPAAKEQLLAADADHFVITESALDQKRSAIEIGQSIVACESSQELTDLVAAISLIKGLEKRMEDTRVAVKAPALEVCQKIDRIAKGYTDTLKTERVRLEAIGNKYQTRVIAEMQAKQEATIAEQRKTLENATTDPLEAARAIATLEIAGNRPTPVSGASQQQDINLEFTDLVALAIARPDLVTITPKIREVKAYLGIPGVAPLPGVVATFGVKVVAKAS